MCVVVDAHIERKQVPQNPNPNSALIDSCAIRRTRSRYQAWRRQIFSALVSIEEIEGNQRSPVSLADQPLYFSNIDLTATILHLAEAEPLTFDLDGRVMPWGNKGASKKSLGTVSHQLSEFWLQAEEEGKWANHNNTLYRSPGCETFFLTFLKV